MPDRDDEFAHRRTLSDSEARWEAVSAIHGVVSDALNGGFLDLRREWGGWTEADELAVVGHVQARIDALIRRPRRALTDSEGAPDA
jgi:hypothetical protein